MATNSGSNIVTAATGKILQGQGVGVQNAFSTSTYPATNAINTILYASASNTMSALATANNGVLCTDGSGVPFINATKLTYTPTCVGNGTAGTTSYAVQTGYYVQLGPIVMASFVVQGTFGGTAAGSVVFNIPVNHTNVSTVLVCGAATGQINSVFSAGVLTLSSNTNQLLYTVQSTGGNLAVIASDIFTFNGTAMYFIG